MAHPGPINIGSSWIHFILTPSLRGIPLENQTSKPFDWRKRGLGGLSAPQEWSENELGRDMWPSFPGMLELCGRTTFASQTWSRIRILRIL